MPAHSATPDSPRSATLTFGVCGWDFADWDGPLYPKPRPKGYRALPFLATFLDFVEVNATFYHPMGGSVSERWLDETPTDFRFLLKAFRGWTHDRHQPRGENLRQFLEVLDPIRRENRCDGVLVQFPPWIRRFDASLRRQLLDLKRAFDPSPLFVEVRDQGLYRLEFFDFLAQNELGFANVDLPAVTRLPQLTSINTNATGYLRLHGRNFEGWANAKATRDERYDYSYSPEDMDEILEKIERLHERTTSVLIAANNHFRGQAPAALVACRQRLGLDLRNAPSTLIDPRFATSHPERRPQRELIDPMDRSTTEGNHASDES